MTNSYQTLPFGTYTLSFSSIAARLNGVMFVFVQMGPKCNTCMHRGTRVIKLVSYAVYLRNICLH